jgi:hypothetical protein
MSEFHAIPIPLGAGVVAATATGFAFSAGRKFELLGVRLAAETAITGHGSNFCAFRVLGSDESTLIWEWSTDTGKEGTVAAKTVYYTSDEEGPAVAGDTAQDYDAAETKTLRTYDGTQACLVQLTKGGSGVSIGDAGLTLIIRYL